MVDQLNLLAPHTLEDVAFEVISSLEPKDVIFGLGISESHLSNVRSKRRRIPLWWLERLDRLDPHHRIARYFAAQLGCKLVEVVDERTPEEQLRDLKEVLARQGETGQNILRAARVRQ